MELITSEVIIDRIKRRFKPIDSNWEGDSLDIIGEAVDALNSMGIKHHKELKWDTVDVVNYRADKPKGEIEFITYDGHLLDKSISRDALNPQENVVSERVSEDIVREIQRLTQQYETLQNLIDRETDLTTSLELQEKQKEVLDEIVEKTKVISVKNTGTYNGAGEYWQTQGKRYIVTSFSTGEITVYYRWYFTDRNGYVYIPDENNYIQSVYYYFAAELIERGYKSSVYSFSDAIQLHENYGYKAKNALIRPDVETRQKMAEINSRMKFNPSLGKSNFRGV